MNTEQGPVRVAQRRRGGAWLSYPLCLLMLVACQKSLEDQLAEAKLQQEIGSWQESVKTLQEILNGHPDQPEANFLLGAAQLALGQAALAIWPLEVAGRSPEHANPADLALGAAYLRLDQGDAAIAVADRVLARDPSDPLVRAGAIQLRAGAHLGMKDWDAVLEDVDRLLALDPENVDALNLMAQALMGAGRIDEAEAALLRIWESPNLAETPAAARAGTSLVRLDAYHREDMDAAEERLAELFQRFPQDRRVVSFVVDFLADSGRYERAVALLEEGLEDDPGDLELRSRLANLRASQGRPEEAEELLVEATELFDSPHAWITLADFYRQQSRYPEALNAFERTLELLPGASELLHFRHAGLLADVGQLDRAEAIAKELEGGAYRNVMLGRIAYLRGRPDEALQYFDAGLREWPNNAGARYLAAKAALSKGDLERGIEELRGAVRSDMDQTDAGLELMLLYMRLGRPATAVGLGTLVSAHGEPNNRRTLGARLLLARALWETGNEQAARNHLDALAKVPGQERPVALERARMDAATGGPGAGARTLLSAGLDLTDPENEPVLRMVCDYEVAAGEADQALRRVKGAISAHPDVAVFHDLHGRLLVNLGRGNEAVAAFERALELDPDSAPALEGKASLLLAGGEREQARELFDRAAAADPGNASYPYQAAQIELAAGRVSEAEVRLRQALERDAVHAHASNDLAWILAERGQDLDRALQLAQRAAEADPSPAVLDTVGWVQYQRGEHAEAASTFERARALEGASPSVSYRLGLALMKTGDRVRAAQLFREALSAGMPFPEAESARRELALLDAGAS